MANLLFYLMAAGMVVAAVGVVVARNPVKSVMALLISFVCLSVIYLLAGFQFLAAIQILLYGGAVMVLFLFVVMLLNLGDPAPVEGTGEGEDEPLFHGGRRALMGIGVAVAMCVAGLVTLVRASLAGLAVEPAPITDAERDRLRTQLLNQRKNAVQSQWVLSLREKADIEDMRASFQQ